MAPRCPLCFAILYACTYFLAFLAWPHTARSQSPPEAEFRRRELFERYEGFKEALEIAVEAAGGDEHPDPLDRFWVRLVEAGQVPYAQGDRVAFLYRGEAASVAWRGEFNGWGVAAGKRLDGTDLWLYETSLPADGRSDYKVFLNGSDWELDPHNGLIMWSGFGPNSELRMPEYEFPQETVRRDGIARGRLGEPQTIQSEALGSGVRYRVYTPAGYASLNNLPTVYVTDGHEYAAEHLGSMVTVLDNLIADGAVRPAIAVFIDPRDPGSGANRRMQQYIANDSFVEFVVDELVPAIDAAYSTERSADARTMLGTSLGGLNAAYFGVAAPEAFHNLIIQSPGFRVYPKIFDLYAEADLAPLNIVLTGGTLGDAVSPRKLHGLLNERGKEHVYLEVHEGHSWGAWRAQLDDALEATVGPPGPAETF